MDFGSVAEGVAHMGDDAFTRRVLMKMDPAFFKQNVAARLFHWFISTRSFGLTRFLLNKGVSVEARNYFGETALFAAGGGDDDIDRVRFLVESGADILLHCCADSPSSLDEAPCPLTCAVFRKQKDFVAFMLNRRPNSHITCTTQQPVLQWASVHYRPICDLLVKHMGLLSPGFLLGDLLDSAALGGHALATYIQSQPDSVSQCHLERALEESITGDRFVAATTLLQYGVDPNGLWLSERPIMTALQEDENPAYIDLFIGHKADVAQPGILERAVCFRKSDVLRKLLRHPFDPDERMKALVTTAQASRYDKIPHADLLLRTGVNINTPGLRLNPLQTAAGRKKNEMVYFLIYKGADINAAAYSNGGRTALQSALESSDPIGVGRLLLRHVRKHCTLEFCEIDGVETA